MDLKIKETLAHILNTIYPVGCYFHTSDGNFDPNTDIGGAWSLLGEGQVLLSAGSNYTAGTQYGGNTKNYTPAGSIGSTTLTDANIAHGHSFTQPKIPAHSHSMGNNWSSGSGSKTAYMTTGNRSQTSKSTATDGGGGACTGGAVGNLGTPSARSGHNHTWTGTKATLDVMQSSTAVYIWHRTA